MRNADCYLCNCQHVFAACYECASAWRSRLQRDALYDLTDALACCALLLRAQRHVGDVTPMHFRIQKIAQNAHYKAMKRNFHTPYLQALCAFIRRVTEMLLRRSITARATIEADQLMGARFSKHRALHGLSFSKEICYLQKAHLPLPLQFPHLILPMPPPWALRGLL